MSGTSEGTEPGQPVRRWKTVALLAGVGAVITAGAAMTTLAVTHRSAVLHNAKAYVNGFVDGVEAAAMMGLTEAELFDY